MEYFVVMELSYISIAVVVTGLYVFVNTHRTVCQKKVSFIVCNLYLSKYDYKEVIEDVKTAAL